MNNTKDANHRDEKTTQNIGSNQDPPFSGLVVSESSSSPDEQKHETILIAGWAPFDWPERRMIRLHYPTIGATIYLDASPP
jgi:hypothetical protein